MGPKLDLGAALGYGFDRLTTRGGAMLIGAYVLLQFATQVTVQSLSLDLLTDLLADDPAADQLAGAYPLAVDLPTTVSAGSSVLLMLVGTVLSVVAIRAVYANVERIPTAAHTRRLVRTTGVVIVTSIIVFLATTIGTVFFLVPGIYLAVSLVFAQHAVVLEDAGVVEALRRSWSLTAGNRLRLFALGFVVAILGGGVGGVSSVFGLFFPVVGAVVSATVYGVLSLFGLAVLVGAYRQLSVENGGTDSVDPAATA